MLQLFPSREIALAVGPLVIHWYGVMYAAGFFLGILMLPRMLRAAGLDVSDSDREKLFLAVFLGVLLGGRLGYVLLYGGEYFVQNPLKIFAVWEGGMSSHGGMIGVVIALWIFARKRGISLLRLGDALVVPVAIGLALGRFGNLINGELYGTVTSVPWATPFPDADGLRHPTQVYAMLKDLVIAAACFVMLSRSESKLPGRTVGLFFLLYGVLRFLVEFFREPTHEGFELLGLALTRGQLLTIPVVIVGIGILYLRRRGMN